MEAEGLTPLLRADQLRDNRLSVSHQILLSWRSCSRLSAGGPCGLLLNGMWTCLKQQRMHFFSFRLTLSWYACLPPPPVNPATIRCNACVKLCFVSCLTLWPDSDWVVTLFYLLLGPLMESSPLWARLSGLICCGKRACNVALHGNHSEALHKHSISTLKRSINRGIAAPERIQLHQHPKNTA